MHINGYVPNLAGGIVAACKHPPAAYHSAAYTGPDKHAEQIIAAVTCAVQPFAPGCGAYVVGNNYGEINGSLQIGLKWNISPIEIGCECYLTGFLFHLSGNANAHTGRWRVSHFPESPHIANNIFDDGRGSSFNIGSFAQPLTDTALRVDMGNLQLGPSQINSYRPRLIHLTLRKIFKLHFW
jgi:hypothetical protein